MGTGDSRRLSEHFVEYYRSCYFSLSNLSHSIIMAGAFKRFIPMFDRVLIERAEAHENPRRNCHSRESSGESRSRNCCRCRPRHQDKEWRSSPFAVTVGDKVLLPEYGGTKVEFESK